MDAFRKDFAAANEAWGGVWRVLSEGEAVEGQPRRVLIQRTDEDEMVLKVMVSPSYPSGTTKLVNASERVYCCSDGQTFDDALDAAMEEWNELEDNEHEDENSEGGMERIGTSDLIAAPGECAEHVVPQLLEKARAELNTLVTHPELKDRVFFFYQEARKKWVIRIATDIAWMEGFRCRALGLNASLVLVVEMRTPYRFLSDGEMPEIADIYMCSKTDLSRSTSDEIPSRNPNVGALKWFMDNR